jgi:hypothetical protein
MAGYLFNLSLVPASLVAHVRDRPRPLGKFVIPATITVLQAALAYLMLVLRLGPARPRPSGDLLLTMVVTSLGVPGHPVRAPARVRRSRQAACPCSC